MYVLVKVGVCVGVGVGVVIYVGAHFHPYHRGTVGTVRLRDVRSYSQGT